MKPPATHVTVDPSGLLVVTGTDVQAALAELDAAVASGGGGGGSLDFADEGVAQGSALTLNVTGAGASVSVAGGVATLTVPGGGGGGGGAETWTVVTATANYTANAGEHVLCDPSAGAFTVTAPTAPSTGDTFVVTKIGNSANVVTLTSAVGLGPYQQVQLPYAAQSITFTFDGSKWQAISQIGSAFVRLPALSAIQSTTYGDDFAGTSLDAKWSRVGFTAAGEQYQQGPQGSRMTWTGSKGPAAYYYQAAPSGDFEVIWAGLITVTGATMVGACILDASSNGAFGGYYNNAPNAPLVGTVSAGSYGGTFKQGAGGEAGSTAFNGTTEVWIRLKKVGTNYTVATSTNGDTWSALSAAVTSAITPARIGFGVFLGTVTMLSSDVFDVR